MAIDSGYPLSQLENTLDSLDRGIVMGSSTVISLLGLDLLGIRQFKIITSLDTWLRCPELLW